MCIYSVFYFWATHPCSFSLYFRTGLQFLPVIRTVSQSEHSNPVKVTLSYTSLLRLKIHVYRMARKSEIHGWKVPTYNLGRNCHNSPYRCTPCYLHYLFTEISTFYQPGQQTTCFWMINVLAKLVIVNGGILRFTIFRVGRRQYN